MRLAEPDIEKPESTKTPAEKNRPLDLSRDRLGQMIDISEKMMFRNAESGFRTVDVFIGGGVKPDHFVDVVVCKKTVVSFLSFPYVCPEPVLVKRSFLYKMAQKTRFLT